MALAEAPKGAAGNVTKRLQKELRTLMLSGGSGISAFPDGDNMFRWIGTIEGGKGTFNKNWSRDNYCGNKILVVRKSTLLEKSVFTIILCNVYEGLRYKLSLTFPDHYPIEAMKVKFVTPCYHPNVDTQGNICLDILKEKWSALYDVRTVLLSIQSLLGEPNIDSPLNVHAADLWKNQENYKKALLDHYNREASRSVNDKGSVKYL